LHEDSHHSDAEDVIGVSFGNLPQQGADAVENSKFKFRAKNRASQSMTEQIPKSIEEIIVFHETLHNSHLRIHWTKERESLLRRERRKLGTTNQPAEESMDRFQSTGSILTHATEHEEESPQVSLLPDPSLSTTFVPLTKKEPPGDEKCDNSFSHQALSKSDAPFDGLYDLETIAFLDSLVSFRDENEYDGNLSSMAVKPSLIGRTSVSNVWPQKRNLSPESSQPAKRKSIEQHEPFVASANITSKPVPPNVAAQDARVEASLLPETGSIINNDEGTGKQFPKFSDDETPSLNLLSTQQEMLFAAVSLLRATSDREWKRFDQFVESDDEDADSAIDNANENLRDDTISFNSIDDSAKAKDKYLRGSIESYSIDDITEDVLLGNLMLSTLEYNLLLANLALSPTHSTDDAFSLLMRLYRHVTKLSEMGVGACTPDGLTYEILILTFGRRLQAYAAGMDLIKEMMDTSRFTPRALLAAFELCRQRSDLNLTKEILQQAISDESRSFPIPNSVYSTYLSMLKPEDATEEALQVLQTCLKVSVLPKKTCRSSLQSGLLTCL
jgi:hypothetical protein